MVELRFSVQPILGLSEYLLSEKVKIEEYKELLKVVNKNAKRLEMIAVNIRDATRIDSQSLKLNKQSIKLNDIIKNVITDLKKERENNEQRKIKFCTPVIMTTFL